jgi:elongation factor Ts
MSTTISASLVKELRDRTGAGMMDCKRTLEETGGDVDEAIRLLREKGMAQAGKRAGRETTEGKVAWRAKGSTGTIVAVGCETEPVSNNDEFIRFAERVLDAVGQDGPDGLASLEDERVELVAKLGENISLQGARLEADEGDVLAGYIHPPANKIGVLVHGKGSPEAARQLAMHVSFAAPRYATRADVPPEDVAAERAIYEKLDEVQSKPEQAREKIVDGMLGKRFFAASPGGVLADQQWIHDTGKTVAQALDEAGFELIGFVRFALGD